MPLPLQVLCGHAGVAGYVRRSTQHLLAVAAVNSAGGGTVNVAELQVLLPNKCSHDVSMMSFQPQACSYDQLFPCHRRFALKRILAEISVMTFASQGRGLVDVLPLPQAFLARRRNQPAGCHDQAFSVELDVLLYYLLSHQQSFQVSWRALTTTAGGLSLTFEISRGKPCCTFQMPFIDSLS